MRVVFYLNIKIRNKPEPKSLTAPFLFTTANVLSKEKEIAISQEQLD